ncbi:uncharacterized protein LOC128788516 [Vidua chalybeata]|uniref:uncharacterized protein LOC128788516 n=1 Tax=Vidua chalybeata TaxID=81927 RepID=UPI0023A902E3|nr:uncharacterized protein LOC128788516 [Vidua chalybeata]
MAAKKAGKRRTSEKKKKKKKRGKIVVRVLHCPRATQGPPRRDFPRPCQYCGHGLLPHLRRGRGNAGERESIGAEQPLEVPEPSPPCPQGRSCPPPAADRSVLESGRRVPAGCRVLGGHRALTSARWAVRFLSHRFPGVLILTSPKPQASLPGPLPLPYLLDAVQNGIRQPSLMFAFSLTLCAARVAQQILKPEEHVYIRVKRFLLSHRYLDLRKVPGFLQLFYSFDFEYKTARVDPQISWGRAA